MRFKNPYMVLLAVMAVTSLSALTSNAQTTSDMSDYTMPNVNPYLVPPGPEAASFLRYGEYQMNYAIGLPDITIPIYTIEAGSIKIPVAISYLAGGIKVTDNAGWAGLGWNVNCGGVINRSVQGLPDKGIPDILIRNPYRYLTGRISLFHTMDLESKSLKRQLDICWSIQITS